MRNMLIVVMLCIICIAAKAQDKALIDMNSSRDWPTLGGSEISGDGKYVFYTVENLPVGKKTLVIHSSDGKWKKEVVEGKNCSFSADSKYVFFNQPNGSLNILTLSSKAVEQIFEVKNYESIKNKFGNWLCYLVKNNDLIVRKLDNTRKLIFHGVISFSFRNDGEKLLISSRQDEALKSKKMTWLDLSNLVSKDIYTGEGVGALVFDGPEKQMAFIANESSHGILKKVILYYKDGDEKASRLPDNQNQPTFGSFSLVSINRFSGDGNHLLLNLKKVMDLKVDSDAVKLNVWSYKDARLQSSQLKDTEASSYLFSLDIASGKISRIQYENESFAYDIPKKCDFQVLYSWKEQPDYSERHWNKSSLRDVYIVSISNGSRKLLLANTLMNYFSSPNGKFLVFYDSGNKNYFSYRLQTGKISNITSKITTNWVHKGVRPEMQNFSFLSNIHLAAWSSDDEYVYLYVDNDIWKVDLTADKIPINLTNGYGKLKGIQFMTAASNNQIVQSGAKKMLLVGFDDNNKQNGFYEMRLEKQQDPLRLTMDDYAYFLPQATSVSPHGIQPLKAKYADVYLLQRMSTDEAPNYFTTKDFRHFSKLTDFNPQKKYNWITSELHKWSDKKGNSHDGILFKPKNFDPKKKYPIIFYYYEVLSYMKNAFLYPGPSGAKIDIPTFVSNGYLVFALDIQYEYGNPGLSALNSVCSAANYISQRPFVNPKKMGLQGHSFGGYETNYIVTHSKLFAAACSSAGLSDLVSMYNEIGFDGVGLQSFVEQGQMRMEKTLWEIPDLYIENSPVFSADKVVTPLLLMHNRKDDAAAFSQGIEMFASLRRLQRPAWLLEYEDGGHSVFGRSGIDFTIRMQQFFDHYLKDAPPPEWMTKGRPASLRGIDDRLKLDYSGSKP